MRRLMESLVLLGAVLALNTHASSAREYCEEMYPSESYEAEDRKFYIDECLQAYGDNSSYDQSSSNPDHDRYYDGTVEDFVESLPDETATEYAE